ncbi:MAG: serine kinase [FCB group bacterium]|nr:serine kinase [FCB group bacterium]
MTLVEIAEALDLEHLTPELPRDGARRIEAGYATDLLSDVLAHAPRGGVLITVQAHLNVIAVAVHAELAAVIFALDRRPDEAVLRKAADQGMEAYLSRDTAFNIAGRLFALGLRGDSE